MKPTYIVLCTAACAWLACAVLVAVEGADADGPSPIDARTAPEAAYRQSELMAPASAAKRSSDLRAVLENGPAIRAYADGTLGFTDRTVLVELAWKHGQSPEFE